MYRKMNTTEIASTWTTTEQCQFLDGDWNTIRWRSVIQIHKLYASKNYMRFSGHDIEVTFLSQTFLEFAFILNHTYRVYGSIRLNSYQLEPHSTTWLQFQMTLTQYTVHTAPYAYTAHTSRVNSCVYFSVCLLSMCYNSTISILFSLCISSYVNSMYDNHLNENKPT